MVRFRVDSLEWLCTDVYRFVRPFAAATADQKDRIAENENCRLQRLTKIGFNSEDKGSDKGLLKVRQGS